MSDTLSTKEVIQRATPWDYQLMKNAVSDSSVDILIRNENRISEEHKAKNRLKIICHVV